MAEIRIDKFLSDRTNYSRKEIRLFLKRNAVQADGKRITDGSVKINPNQAEVFLNGKKIHGGTELFILVNKPEGYICATEDAHQKTVLALLPEELRHKDLFPAGRLDIDTTGLVLLTTDGKFAHSILSPKHHIPKYYLVQLENFLTEEEIKLFSSGIKLNDGTECLPAEVKTLSGKICLLCLHEGKYHQVKRMFAATGNHVKHLHRIGIGNLLLPEDLPEGGCREIFHKEIQEMLKNKTFQEMYEQIVNGFSSYWINEGQ